MRSPRDRVSAVGGDGVLEPRSIPSRSTSTGANSISASETFAEPIIKIGKVASSHLRLEDDVASRMHAMIEVTGPDEIYIIDLGSAAGTFVNGQRSNKARLQNGDEIVVGETRLMVEIGATADEDATMAVDRSQVGSTLRPWLREHAEPRPGSGYRSAGVPGQPGTLIGMQAPAVGSVPPPRGLFIARLRRVARAASGCGAFAARQPGPAPPTRSAIRSPRRPQPPAPAPVGQPAFAPPSYGAPALRRGSRAAPSTIEAAPSTWTRRRNPERFATAWLPARPRREPGRGRDRSRRAVEVMVMWGDKHPQRRAPDRRSARFYVGEPPTRRASPRPTT